MSTSQDILRRLSKNISIVSSKPDEPSAKKSRESFESDGPSPSISKLQKLPTGLSVEKSSQNASDNPLSKLSSSLGSSMLSITRTSSLASSQRVSINKSANSDDISRQTLNQPLNPTAFQPGALRGFPKNRSQVADTRNRRNYPQLSNESLKRRASTFMAAPNQEILAQMRKEGVAKDFNAEECKSTFEYLDCLLGYGLHQTLNFPIMGVFYLELAKLVMSHMDRFSEDEKVRLIQVRNVCENILRRNSIREDFLPVDIMDEIVERAIEEEDCAQIRDFSDDEEGMSEDDREDMSDDDMGDLNNGAKEKEDMEMSDEDAIKEKDKSIPASDLSNSINRKLHKFSGLSISKSNSDDKALNLLSKVSVTKSKTEGKSGNEAAKQTSGKTKSASSNDSDDDVNNMYDENDDLQDLDKQLKEIDNQIASGYKGVKKPAEKTGDDLLTLDDFSDSDDESTNPTAKKISETKKMESDDLPLEDDGDLFSDSDDEPSDELIEKFPRENSSVTKKKPSPQSARADIDSDSDDEFTKESSVKKGSEDMRIPSPPKGQSKIKNLVSDIRSLLGEDQKNQTEADVEVSKGRKESGLTLDSDSDTEVDVSKGRKESGLTLDSDSDTEVDVSKGRKESGLTLDSDSDTEVDVSKGRKESGLTLDSDSDSDFEGEVSNGKDNKAHDWNDF